MHWSAISSPGKLQAALEGRLDPPQRERHGGTQILFDSIIELCLCSGVVCDCACKFIERQARHLGARHRARTAGMGLQEPKSYEITRKGEVDNGMLRAIFFVETNGT